MPTSTVPYVKTKPVKPTTINPDTLERQHKGRTPPPKPKPTRPITVPALNPKEQQRVDELEETIYSARSQEREGVRTTVGGSAAETWRDKRLRLSTSLGLNETTKPGMGIYERFRAGQIKGDSWRTSIETMDMLKTRWSKSIVGRGAANALSVVGTMIGSQGRLNPLSPFTDPFIEYYRGNKSAAIKGGISSAIMQLGMLAMTAASLEGERDNFKVILRQNGVPEEYLDEAVSRYIESVRIPTYVNMTAAGTVNDAQIIAASMAGGALIGSALPGVGTLAGAGLGWTSGTIIAGANNLIAMITMNQGPNLHSVIPYNAYEDRAFLTSGWTESTGNKAVADFLAEKDPNRFVPYDEAAPWIDKYWNAASPLAGDPRNKEIYDLVKQGYFVNKNYDGTYGIDPYAWQAYMVQSALYKTPEDKKRYLPELTTAGKEFAADSSLIDTRDGWNSIWRNMVNLEYEP